MAPPFHYIDVESPKISPNHDSDRARGDPLLDLILPLLPITLSIGFRLITPGQNLELCDLNHTPHHNRVFETASQVTMTVLLQMSCARGLRLIIVHRPVHARAISRSV